MNGISQEDPDSTEYYSRILRTPDTTSIDKQRTVLKEKIYELQTLVDTVVSTDALGTAKQHVIMAINSLKNINRLRYQFIQLQNSLLQMQIIRFHSTKKKK